MQLGGASSCNHALDGVYKAPRGTHPHASAKAALPALVADFLDPQIIAQADELVGQLAMQAAPVRRQFALGSRQTPAGLLIALTFPPHTVLLAAASFVDAALCIVVLRIVGPTLALQMALQPPAFARIGCQFLGKQQQALGHLVQAVFGEPILRAQACEDLPARSPAWAGSAFMRLRRFIASASKAL
jgi:hypothetical protein